MKFKTNLTLILGFLAILFGCNQTSEKSSTPDSTALANSRKQIASMLDSFNIAAANADFSNYFNFYT